MHMMGDGDESTATGTFGTTITEVGLFTAPVGLVMMLVAFVHSVQPFVAFLGGVGGLTLTLSLSRITSYEWVLD